MTKPIYISQHIWLYLHSRTHVAMTSLEITAQTLRCVTNFTEEAYPEKKKVVNISASENALALIKLFPGRARQVRDP